MQRPPILLADEPTGNLDSTTGQKILALLRDACRRHGTTVVMVTHDAGAARIGTRLITLKDGRLSSDEMLATPTQPLGAAVKLLRQVPQWIAFAIGNAVVLLVLMLALLFSRVRVGRALRAVSAPHMRTHRLRTTLTVFGVGLGVARGRRLLS